MLLNNRTKKYRLLTNKSRAQEKKRRDRSFTIWSIHKKQLINISVLSIQSFSSFNYNTQCISRLKYGTEMYVYQNDLAEIF